MSDRSNSPPTVNEVRVAAMDLLARREHARGELQTKLQRRFADAELVAGVLDALAAENLQSDARYAESLLRQRLDRGYGPVRIQQEMRERGVDAVHIAAALEAVAPHWREAAEQVYARKFDPVPESPAETLDNPVSWQARSAEQQQRLKEKARRMRFMQYRGFLPEHFRHLLED